MVSKLLNSFTNKIKFDDHGSYINKRIDQFRILYYFYLDQYFTKLVKDMRNAI